MSATEKTTQETAAAQGRRLLQDLHEQGIIDLDAPMRQLFDRMETSDDVSGYQFTTTSKIESPTPDQWWVFAEVDKGGSGGRVLAGSDVKTADGLRQ